MVSTLLKFDWQSSYVTLSITNVNESKAANFALLHEIYVYGDWSKSNLSFALKSGNRVVDSCSTDLLCHPSLNVCVRRHVGPFWKYVDSGSVALVERNCSQIFVFFRW